MRRTNTADETMIREINELRARGRYTVIYEGYLFFGDSDGLNMHDYDRWDEVSSLINAYGDMIIVQDNEYGVTFANGEWY